MKNKLLLTMDYAGMLDFIPLFHKFEINKLKTQLDKMHFALKLIPIRPSFAQDMNDEERAIMQQHIVYWNGLMEQGKVIVYGPVMDPAGAYGLGVVEVENEEEVKELTSNDPAATINTYEYYPMRAITPKK